MRQITVFTYFTTIDRPKIPLHQVYHHPFDSIFHGLQFGMHHYPLIFWPKFFLRVKVRQIMLLTYSTTIYPPKLLLDPRTIKFVIIHSIAFFAGYNLVCTNVLRFLGEIFSEGKSAVNHDFYLLHEYVAPKTPPRPSYNQVCHHPFDSIFDGLQSGIDHWTTFSWPIFSGVVKCAKTRFFTYSTTIQPPKSTLDPLTIMSISIHSIAFLTGYNLVGTTALRFLEKCVLSAKER